MVLELLVAAAVLEDLQEFRLRRALRKNLVMDAAEKGFIHQFRRANVRGKHNHGHERDVELLPCLERQEIDAAFERYDPPVQQIPRRTVLAPEVVDHEDAAVRNRLDK